MSANNGTPAASFSMPFSISVENLFTFKDQCMQIAGVLHTADSDAMRASSIVGQQEALLVEECQHDLQTTSNVCEEISNDLTALANALSELAWSMKSVRDEYKGIAQKALGCGLIVVGDKVILFDESDDNLVHSFNELQAQAKVQQLNYERAEYVFSLALDNLKVDVYEQWIEPVFDALKEQFILDDKHPIAKAIPYGVGLLDMSGQITIGASMWHFNRLYEPPKGFFAKGDLSKWTYRPIGRHGLEPMATRSVSPIATKIGKVAGPIGAVVDGGITAYDTYQTDTQQHPEWSEEHKIARAGTKGTLAGLGTWGGAALGAKGGAAIGAAVSGPFAPVGAVVGGIVGGVIGGVIGHYTGEKFGDGINSVIDSHMDKE
nr:MULTISPECIES: glycine zipper domain-containing protein [Schaalia]